MEEEAMGPPLAGRASKPWTGFPGTATHEVRGCLWGTSHSISRAAGTLFREAVGKYSDSCAEQQDWF